MIINILQLNLYRNLFCDELFHYYRIKTPFLIRERRLYHETYFISIFVRTLKMNKDMDFFHRLHDLRDLLLSTH